MDETDAKLRRAAELIQEAAGVAVAVGSPLSFGRKIVELLLRLHANEPLPGLPDYFLDWLNDIQLDIRAHGDRLFALETDRGRQMVIGNYGEQAWREANDVRRKMLGDAVLAVIVCDLSVSDLARAERTIRVLDPEDLHTLRELDRIVAYERARKDGSLDHRGRRANYGAQGAAFHALREGHLGGALLESSGCVSAAAIAGGGEHGAAYVTPLGELVLRFMGSAR